jgi:hypothetical protein
MCAWQSIAPGGACSFGLRGDASGPSQIGMPSASSGALLIGNLEREFQKSA